MEASTRTWRRLKNGGASSQGIWLSTVVGCTLMAVMLVFCDNILLTMGANAEIFPFARRFMMIRALAAPAEVRFPAFLQQSLRCK